MEDVINELNSKQGIEQEARWRQLANSGWVERIFDQVVKGDLTMSEQAAKIVKLVSCLKQSHLFYKYT